MVILVHGNDREVTDIYNQICNKELRHFGVKGMKWGHHKTQIEASKNHRTEKNKEGNCGSVRLNFEGKFQRKFERFQKIND